MESLDEEVDVGVHNFVVALQLGVALNQVEPGGLDPHLVISEGLLDLVLGYLFNPVLGLLGISARPCQHAHLLFLHIDGQNLKHVELSVLEDGSELEVNVVHVEGGAAVGDHEVGPGPEAV